MVGGISLSLFVTLALNRPKILALFSDRLSSPLDGAEPQPRRSKVSRWTSIEDKEEGTMWDEGYGCRVAESRFIGVKSSRAPKQFSLEQACRYSIYLEPRPFSRNPTV